MYWNNAPAVVYTDARGTIILLPEGHADLGYAPGSQFYASDADLADLECRHPHTTYSGPGFTLTCDTCGERWS